MKTFFAFLCATVFCLPAAADYTIDPVDSGAVDQTMNPSGPAYRGVDAGTVGTGFGFIASHTEVCYFVFDTSAVQGAVTFRLVGSGGTYYHILQPSAPYAAYAGLGVTVTSLPPPPSDPAAAFAAVTGGTDSGAFHVDNGVTPPFSLPYGNNFSVPLGVLPHGLLAFGFTPADRLGNVQSIETQFHGVKLLAQTIPEPASCVLLASGVVGVLLFRRF